MKNRLAVFALVTLTLGMLATTASPKAFAAWLIDGSGTLIRLDGAILGDDNSTGRTQIEAKDEIEDEDEDGIDDEDENEADDDDDDSSLSEAAKRQMEQQREAAKQRLESSRELLKKQIEIRKTLQEKSGQKSQFEIRTENGKIKIKQELRDSSGRLIRKTETDLEDDSLHVEQETGEELRINAVDDHLELVRNRIKATSNLELKVGEKNDISVTLPNGKTREISIPDKALENLINNGVITPTQDASGSATYQLTAGKNGEPVYLADGVVEKKILGIPFLKLKFAQKLEVAASDSDDGAVLAGEILDAQSQETNFLLRFLERISR